MPSFGKRSRDKLKDAHPRLIRLFEEVVKRYDCCILSSHRSPECQEDLVDAGLARSLKSKHLNLPAQAVDAVPWPFSSKDWKDAQRLHHFAGYVMATCHQMQRDGRLDASFELRSGLDFDGQGGDDESWIMDGPHFEIRELIENS